MFLELGSLSTAFYVACVLGAVATIKGFLLAPWLSGKATRMNQVAVVAVPLMATIKAICERVPSLRPAAQLLAE